MQGTEKPVMDFMHQATHGKISDILGTMSVLMNLCLCAVCYSTARHVRVCVTPSARIPERRSY